MQIARPLRQALHVLGMVAVGSALVLAPSPRPAAAQNAELVGSAFGFFTSVGLFGGEVTDIGPAPLVTLPPDGSVEPITMTDPDGSTVQFGPAVIVEPVSMTVSTQGDSGSVTSTAVVTFAENQDDQLDPFNADDLSSECTAASADPSGRVVLTAASLVLSTDENTGDPTETTDIPAEPEPNTTFGGTIDHIGDTFRVVFNEQIRDGGVLTVNAVHFYFGQDAAGQDTDGVAQGEAVIGQTVCGAGTAGSGSSVPAGGGRNGATEGSATEQGDTATLAAENRDGGGGGGAMALLIGALALGGIVVAALAIRSRQAEPPSEV